MTSFLAVTPDPVSPWVYAGFIAVVLCLLALDLGVLNRKAHTPSMAESLRWTSLWVSVALLFGVCVYFLYRGHVNGLGLAVPVVGSPGVTMTIDGFEAVKLYLAAYLVEESLSMDNVFVIAMIFTSLGIPTAYQHRVLFWGILGAIMMRGLMIGLGVAVITRFSWIGYVFGGLLILSAVKMALVNDEANDISKSRTVRLVSRVLPISKELEGQRLLSMIGGRWHGTPLLVALVVIEVTDLLFAVDSIPAVFAITADPFIVFTSNIMAILGLRSLYFCLASAMTMFKHLKTALIAVLLFVGIKMCLVHTPWKIPTEVSLIVVVGLLALGIGVSLLSGRGPKPPASPPEPDDGGDSARGHAEADADEAAVAGVADTGDRNTHSHLHASLPPPHAAPGAAPPAGSADAPSMPEPPRWLARFRQTHPALRRVVVLTVGVLVLVAGVLVSPLPGPGLSILGPLGIAILASEFVWAHRFAGWVLRWEKVVRLRVDPFFRRASRLWIAPIVVLYWLGAWALSAYTTIHDLVVWPLSSVLFTPMLYGMFRWWRVRRGRAHTPPPPGEPSPA